MSSSSEQTPKIHRFDYEPTALPTASATACPHCGGTGEVPSPTADAARAENQRVEVTAGLPDTGPVRRLIGRLLGLMFEVIDGRRPVEQLTEITTPSVLRYIRATRPTGRLVRVSRVRSVRVCCPTEYAVEAAAVVQMGSRVRAVAARFEHTASGWRCVALRIL